MELNHTSRSRRRWLVSLAIGSFSVTGTGALASASAPPDRSADSIPASAPAASPAPSEDTTTTTAPPECVVADAAAPTTTATPTTTEMPTTTAAPTTAPTTTATPSTAAATAASPSIDVPLPEGSPADGSTPLPPGGSVTPDEQIVLARDGIGIGRFCDDADTVIAAVTEVLGEPADDTGWADPLSISNCAGTEVRRVTWGSLDLYFGDTSRFADGVRHFFGFVYGNRDSLEVTPQGLATPEGIGIGSTVEYLLANYPDAEVFPGEEGLADPLFYVDENLGGFLTDDAADGVVTVVFGGEDCGV